MHLLNKYDVSIIDVTGHDERLGDIIKIMEKSLEFLKWKSRIVTRILNLFTV